MKTKLKNNVKLIIGFIVGVIITSGIVYAATASDQVTYSTEKNANVKNVSDALNDLYSKSNGQNTGKWADNSTIIGDFRITTTESNIDYSMVGAEGTINTDNGNIKAYILFYENKVIKISESLPIKFDGLEPNSSYKDVYVIAIDENGNTKKSSNNIEVQTPTLEYIYNAGTENLPLSAQYTSSNGTRTKNAKNLYMDFNDGAGSWHYSCYFGTNSKIDVTNIKKIYVKYSDVSLTGDTTTVISLASGRGTYSPSGTVHYHQEKINGKNMIIQWDVSNLTGSYYLDFGIGSHNKDYSPVDSSGNNSCTGTGAAYIECVAYENK